MKCYLLMPLALVLMLQGCAWWRPQPPLQEQFRTHITAAGDKQFEFELGRPHGTDDQPHMGDRRPYRGAESGISRESISEQLDAKLAAKLQDNQYCRSGFHEIERALTLDGLLLRGRCNEPATAADRKRFSNSVLGSL